jgi:hypothetical protein
MGGLLCELIGNESDRACDRGGKMRPRSIFWDCAARAIENNRAVETLGRVAVEHPCLKHRCDELKGIGESGAGAVEHMMAIDRPAASLSKSAEYGEVMPYGEHGRLAAATNVIPQAG